MLCRHDPSAHLRVAAGMGRMDMNRRRARQRVLEENNERMEGWWVLGSFALLLLKRGRSWGCDGVRHAASTSCDEEKLDQLWIVPFKARLGRTCDFSGTAKWWKGCEIQQTGVVSRLLAWVFTFYVCADGIWQIYRRYFNRTPRARQGKKDALLFIFVGFSRHIYDVSLTAVSPFFIVGAFVFVLRTGEKGRVGLAN